MHTNDKMNPRTHDGHMDWEWQEGRGPVDSTSPWVTNLNHNKANVFANTFRPGSQRPAVPASSSPAKQSFAQPPHSSIFTPQLSRQYNAPSLRNPAFTTPQRSQDDSLMSEASPWEDSPALTDRSEGPADTPDIDTSKEQLHRSETQATVTPSRLRRGLFGGSFGGGGKAAGRGEIARGKSPSRDKVRKRKRIYGDKDVGSARTRQAGDSDGSGSEEDLAQGKSLRAARQAPEGWMRSFMRTMSDYPSVPVILTFYLQLVINLAVVTAFLWVMWSIVSIMRSDLASATEKERNKLLSEMQACMLQFQQNKCAPAANRMPALDALCNEWDHCMNQDPSSVMRAQVSVKNVAEILNEFSSAISYKAAAFILIIVILSIWVAGLGKGRPSYQVSTGMPGPPQPTPSRSLDRQQPFLASNHHPPNQAYITMPLKDTPRHFRRAYFPDDQTDTDASPDQKAIMAPPKTPSRRSPSKADRFVSPSKRDRSPAKMY